jgi:YD repeat-containing protein
VTSADPAGHVTRTTYDKNGNVTATEADIESGRIAQTEVTYDHRDMPVKVKERFDGDARKEL